MLNKVQLIGWLGHNPVVFNAHDEHRLCVKFDVSTTVSYKDKNRVRVSKTEWHRVTLFGRQAEFARRNLEKSSKVYVEGRLQTSKWDDNGVDRYSTEIIGNTILSLDTRKAADESGENHSGAARGEDSAHPPGPQVASQPAAQAKRYAARLMSRSPS